MRLAGLFRMLVPAGIGGGETEPAEAIAAIEAIAEADAAAGWVVAVCSTAGLIAARLDEPVAREIAGRADSVSCGVFAPKGKAVEADAELTLTGRWPLASGIAHADWVGLGCLVAAGDGPPAFRYAILPRGEVEVIDTWRALGLRATSSHDVAVDGARVPVERSTNLFTDPPRFDGALYRFPVFGVLALAIGAVCTGIARSALDEVVALATEKTPAGSRRRLAERGVAQARVAEAEAALRAARALVAEAIGAAWALSRELRDPAYEDWYAAWWAHAQRCFIDRVAGSWRHELDPQNRPAATVWAGKPDIYHAYQAALLPSLGPAASFAGALTRGRDRSPQP